MSSILKALKKLENDNTNRKPGSFKVDAEILRDGVPHHFPLIGTSLIAAFLFICGVGATYFYLRPVNANKQQAESLSIPAFNQPGKSTSQTPVDVVVKVDKQIDRTESAAVEKSDAQSQPQVRSAAIVPAPVPKNHDSLMNPKVHSVKTVEPVNPDSKPIKAVATEAKLQHEPDLVPLLKVNGIAFQARNEDSMAVVNGVTVSNGSLIAGAKVESILQDRVQFSYKGEKFDVVMGKSNR